MQCCDYCARLQQLVADTTPFRDARTSDELEHLLRAFCGGTWEGDNPADAWGPACYELRALIAYFGLERIDVGQLWLGMIQCK